LLPIPTTDFGGVDAREGILLEAVDWSKRFSLEMSIRNVKKGGEDVDMGPPAPKTVGRGEAGWFAMSLRGREALVKREGVL
jgi:hypothetical protein